MSIKASQNRAIITVIGKDTVGIVAQVSQVLAKRKINIVEIDQKIMDNNFVMTMLVDLHKSELSVAALSQLMQKTAQKVGQIIHVYDEQLIHKMHRI